MAISTPTIIDKPDGATIAPGAGHLYVNPSTIGCTVRSPGFVFGEADIQGNAPIDIDQNGLLQGYGGQETTLQARGFMLRGLFQTLSSAGQVLLAPDFTINASTGQTSYARVNCTVDGLDWLGGIAVPRFPGGASPFGAVLRAINISSGGQTINVWDPVVGGGTRVGSSVITWSYLEIIEWTYDNLGWQLSGKMPSYHFSGGTFMGGRLCKTSSTAAKKLYPWVKGAGSTFGLGAECDVVASDPVGGAIATYAGVRFAYDTANNLYLSSGAAAPRVQDFAANAQAVALGFTGGELSLLDDASNHNLMGTPPTATALTWKVLNVRNFCGSST